MFADRYEILTGDKCPELLDISHSMVVASWPEFMLHDEVVNRYWNAAFKAYPQFHFGLFETSTRRIVALGNSVPLAWEKEIGTLPDRGFDWALEKSVTDHETGQQPTVQCALQIVIANAFRSQGLSSHMVQAMRSIGRTQGLDALIAPVRPNLKSRYPVTPMERFIMWKNDDGHPFDNWLRVHAKLGARIVKVCPHSMLISGTVSDWESWSDMRFPESGDYIVPGALTTVAIDRERNHGTYVEPNVWMYHPPQ